MTILSHSFWQRKFGGDSAVIGKTVEVNGNPRDDRRRRIAGLASRLRVGHRDTGAARPLSGLSNRL